MEATAQTKQILSYLQGGNSITPLEALNLFGCFRLGARIFDIEHKMGVKIEHGTHITPEGKRVGKYWIESKN